MKTPPSPKPESERAAARRLTESMGFPISRDMIRSWKKRGFDLGDLGKLRRQLLNSERPPRQLLATAPHSPTPPSAASGEPMTPAELDARLARLEGELLEAQDYETARKIRVQISGCRELFKIQVERGSYSLNSEVEKFIAFLATESRQRWEGLETELPPLLEGLETAAAMSKELRVFSRRVCQELADIFGKPDAS